MRAPVEEWGRRLGSRVREAIDAGDLALASRLVHEGDGQAHDLAGEYAFMVRGLDLTLRVLLSLLGAQARRCTAPAPAAELCALVGRFRRDLLRFAAQEPPVESSHALSKEIVAAQRALEAAIVHFAHDQKRRADDIARAIEACDRAQAATLLDERESDGYLPLHDRLVRFMADAFAWVLRHCGADELLRFHLDAAEGQRAGFEKWERMSPAEFAWTSAFLLKQHMGEVRVRDDAEAYVIEQGPCGSGGRLRLAGAYAGDQALPYVETRGALTFGESRMPVYCSHCAIWNGLATLRWFGRAQWVFERPARADGACTLRIYKRLEDAPPEYARRLGVQGGA